MTYLFITQGRCIHANERCTQEIPEIKSYDDVSVACHAVDEGRI